jgi:hypothetical protein
MQWMQSTYSRRFNVRHRQWGHVIQGRYKAILVDRDEEGYFGAVSAYIHLNPVRADLVKGEERIRNYAWSSFPMYLKGHGSRPGWIVTERVLGSLGLRDESGGRREYERYVEGRAAEWRTQEGREAMNKEWKPIGRGWRLGEEEFRERMQEALEAARGGKRRSTYSGEQVKRHDQRQAEKLVTAGLKALGLSQKDLASLPKGHASKRAVAWLARKRTVVSNEWIGKRLRMGCASNVSGYVASVEQARTRELARLRAKLTRAAAKADATPTDTRRA